MSSLSIAVLDSPFCLQRSPPPGILDVSFSDEAHIVDSIFTLGNHLESLAGMWLWRASRVVSPWPQSYDPSHHWLLSALWAALPLAVLLVAMAGLRIKGHFSALAGVCAPLALSVPCRTMPVRVGVWDAV